MTAEHHGRFAIIAAVCSTAIKATVSTRTSSVDQPLNGSRIILQHFLPIQTKRCFRKLLLVGEFDINMAIHWSFSKVVYLIFAKDSSVKITILAEHAFKAFNLREAPFCLASKFSC